MPISRAQLTEEFFDRTSATLLAQPEPQYLYARLFLRALNIELSTPEMIGRPGGMVSGQGADYSSAERDRLELAGDDMATELFAAKADFAGEPGHVIKFNRPKFTNSTYTQAAREIGTNQTISTVAIAAGSEQAHLQIKRFGGPYDTANTRVAPYGLDAFDATMGVHNLSKFVGTHLKRDFHRTLDSFWVTLADLASTTVRPVGMTIDNTATAPGMFPMSYELMSRTTRAQDEANLPTLGDGRRIFVVSPAGKKQLKDDPQFAKYAEFNKETNPLFPGWFGSTAEYHCFVSTTLTVTANSSSVNIHSAHAIAPGAFMGGRGSTIGVAASSDDNFGQTAKVIWLAFMALGLADNRFVTKVNFTEDAV